jgi:hypothetical protein
MDSDFSQDLSAWLDDVADDRYEVDRTLKETADETTEVVYRRDDSGERLGPFVRKRIAHDLGRGAAYGQILRAQTSGIRLSYQPIVYECANEGDTLCVVTEYVYGQTLREVVRREGPSRRLYDQLAPQLCDALTELHERLGPPIIHRDVKPSNIMLTGDRIVLIDLGIARTYHEGAARDTVRYGTPGYAPPEQYGYGQTDERSDVYAMGMTLAYCLLGEDPTAQLRGGGFADERIPAEVRPVLTRATQFDPNDRYASARELKAAVLGCATQSAEAKSRPTVPGRSASTRPDTPAKPATSGRFSILGRVWNALVLILWAGFVIATGMRLLDPNDTTTDLPLVARLAMYLFAVLVPFTMGGYLLLDRRRIRAHTPLGRYTLKQEVLFCLGMAVLSLLLLMVVVLVLGMISAGLQRVT